MAWEQKGNLKGPAGTIEIGTVSTGAPDSEVQITNRGTDQAAVLDIVIPQGMVGEDGKGIAIAGDVDTYVELPTGLTLADAGKGYFVKADGKLYIWTGSAFPADGSGAAFQGPEGKAATVTIDSVVTGNAGTQAAVANVGTPSAAKFKFTIPKGDAGDNGAGATIEIGAVTTGAPGSAVAFENVGTASAVVLNISVPKGADGDDGDDGLRGSQWSLGEGPPINVSAAVAGDNYLDVVSGIVYEQV